MTICYFTASGNCLQHAIHLPKEAGTKQFRNEHVTLADIIKSNEQIVTELAKDLCAFFHQESVMVTTSPASVVFIKESI